MALISWQSVSLSSSSSLLLLLQLQSQKHTLIPKPFIYPGLRGTSLSLSLSSISITPKFRICFCSTSVSATSDSASLSVTRGSPSPNIFIKGLPQSTSEGRLTKAFSEFGQVNRVKILIDTNSGHSLGFAYIWFAKEEFAQLAVKQMNGKFFDGRFIFVTIAKPRSSRIHRTVRHYKF
ncbi:Splicing factor-like protein [Parasponia andersonii]|uniref:Splicing factor-like protein n=1 Tax=Parasponia andersonii TaxID=3476 RepID=A0A2P5E3S4_PARAD|nr:Splicing factor-like protein [Parasponia andersonii]